MRITEVYINGERVDTDAATVFPFNYGITDIKKPDARTGAYSKTISLPGTARNNKLFTHIFEVNLAVQSSGTVNFQPDFNPALKAEFVAYADTLEQFNGFVRLMKISTTQGNFIRYECHAQADLSNIFKSIGDGKLTDLSLSEYNHAYNKTAQKASWTATVGAGYVYPMIEYGFNSAGQSVSQGQTWNVDHFFPAVYLKTYIDKIFEYAGFQYDSSFFTSAFFKHLIIPYNGDSLRLTSSQVAARLIDERLSANASGTVTYPGGTTLTIPYDQEISDPSNQYSTGGSNPYNFVAANAGTYSFFCSGTAEFFAVTNVVDTQPSVHFNFKHFNSGTGVTTTYPGPGQLYGLQNGVTLAGTFIQAVNLYGTSAAFYMNAGDRVYVEAAFSADYLQSGNFSGTLGYRIRSGARFTNIINNSSITDGNTLSMASAIPEDVRMADLLKWVFKRFNLYVDVDRTTPNKLIIEPRDDFYAAGGTVNWTTKLDISKPFEQEPLGAMNARRYTFKDKDTEDYFNKFYREKWGEQYGDYRYDVVNDFVFNEETIETGFAPAPLKGSSSYDRVVTALYSLDNSGNPVAKKSTLRLLYYGGVLATLNSWTYTGAVSGSSTETTWPYAGHLDNPYTPTVDLNWFVPREIYYSYPGTQYTNNNCFNQYWKAYVEEITHRDSRLVTAYFHLTPVDILTLDFRDKIYVEKEYYRLYRIFDYDPSANVPTKVQLLKVAAAIPFTGFTTTITGGSGSLIGDDRAPQTGGSEIGMNGNVGGNVWNSSVISGRDNSIGDNSSGIVGGSSNRMGQSIQRGVILGASGVTMYSDVNAVVIGGNDQTITRDGLYIGGAYFPFAANLYHAITTDKSVPGTARFFDFTAIANATLPPNESLKIGDELFFIKTTATVGTCVITARADQAINGAGSQNISSQYGGYILKYVTEGIFFIVSRF